MKSNIILIKGSSNDKRTKFLQQVHEITDTTYIKLEALLSSISETLGRKITEDESIHFLDNYIKKINKDGKIHIIDINECKQETLDKIIEDKEINVIELENIKMENGNIYIDNNETLKEKLERIKREIEGE